MNRQKGKRKRGRSIKYLFIKETQQTMNIYFAYSARTECRFPLFYCISRFP